MPLASSLPCTARQRGVLPARPPHPPTLGTRSGRPSAAAGAAHPRIGSVCTQRGGAACSELAACLRLINISCSHFFTSTHGLQFSLPPVPSHCSCVLSLRWDSHGGHSPGTHSRHPPGCVLWMSNARHRNLWQSTAAEGFVL